MKQRIAVMFVLALSLAACQRNESSSVTPLTGGFGAAVVTGDVRMADGGSAEGVEVSVRGTGMSMILAADGRFAFASVPEEGQLGFRRQSDGVEASLDLAEVSSHLSIELTKTEARRSSRRRGVGAGDRVREFEGLVMSATATEVVMFTSKKEEVKIALVPETVIRKGGTLMTAADLLPDMRIHVKAKNVGETWTAVMVIVQKLPGEDDDDDDDGEDDDTPAVRKEYEGLVVSATAAQLVLLDSHRNEVTFAITPETVIRKGNTPVAPADIQAGWRVHVKSSAAADGALTAVRITIQKNK
jgi:hypothetical protein